MACCRWFQPAQAIGRLASAPRSQPRWVAADQNPFGVAILDLTPVTQDLTAWSSDPVCASNAISFGGDDGSTFVGVLPRDPTSVALDLRYPTDDVLADGPLFLPSHMEQKWALFLRDGKLIFVRSWRREVVAIADVSVANGEAILSRLTGSVAGGAELRPERVVDFLVRTHVLGEPFPAPIDGAEGRDLTQLAHECFSLFGRFATCATPHEVPHRPPRRPLRSYSLLHLAIARGDIEAAARHVASGVPIDLLAADGLAPLHWASVCADGVALEWLLEHGAQVDAPSAEGATPLMNAVQARRSEHVERLLAHGVWANKPVPLFPYPGSPDYSQRWGKPDDRAWERAHEYYLNLYNEFSDVQEERPLPLQDLERGVSV